MTTSAHANEGFQDPLEDYEPVVYDDALEQALAEEDVSAIPLQPYASVSPQTSVAEAVQTLVGDEIACLLVEDNGKLVGVFSDRDILDKVALEYDDVKNQPVQEVMTADPVFVLNTDSASAALAVMAVSGYRHVPVVDFDTKIVGIISPKRITRFLRERFSNTSS